MFNKFCLSCLAFVLLPGSVLDAGFMDVELKKAPKTDQLLPVVGAALEIPHLQFETMKERSMELRRQNLLIPCYPDLVAIEQDPFENGYSLPSMDLERANEMDRFHPWLKLDQLDWTSPKDYEQKVMMKRFLRQPISRPSE